MHIIYSIISIYPRCIQDYKPNTFIESEYKLSRHHLSNILYDGDDLCSLKIKLRTLQDYTTCSEVQDVYIM